MKIVNVVCARPNFIKIAPLIGEMPGHPEITSLLVYTGQHYDVSMAEQLFLDLQMSLPDVSREIGSRSHAYQAGEVMKRLELILERELPDLFLVGYPRLLLLTLWSALCVLFLPLD